MKLTKKAHNLFIEVFLHDGRRYGSGIHTDTGTMPLWGQLVIAGLVTPMQGIPLGHNFEYDLTEAGISYLKQYEFTGHNQSFNLTTNTEKTA